MKALSPARNSAARDGGFSLLEILISLAILALAVAVVGMAFGRSSIGYRHEAAARELAHDLQEAHARALRTGRDVTVTIDVDARFYQLEQENPVRLPADVDLDIVSAGEVMSTRRRPAIVFLPDGGSTGASITLAGDNRRTTISVDWLTGRVAVVTGGGNGADT